MIDIYVLERNNIPFYIGKTKDFISRRYKHKWNSGNDIEMWSIDFVPENKWKFWERHYISLFKSWGFILENKNDGGGGLEKHLDETKRKIAKGLLGGKRSEETKLKMKLPKLGNTFRRGQKQSQETIAKRVSKTKGKKRTEEFKINRSILLKGKPKPIGFGEKVKIHNSKPVLQYDLINNFIKEYKSLTEAAYEVGVNASCLTDCCRGKQKTSAGFKWKYKN